MKNCDRGLENACLSKQKKVFVLRKSSLSIGLIWCTNKAYFLLSWFTNIADVTSCEYALCPGLN